MAEEDQESHFDDPEEQEPMKVSVTFKPPEPENDDFEFIETLEDQTPVNKTASEDPGQANDTRHEYDTEEPGLPINPPVTPIPSCVDAARINSEYFNGEQLDVLEGWKGYSNNIYIQPIIVNHASCDTCPYPANRKTQRRLTSQDLSKQMRFREANSWITKHNERVRSTGSLRTRSHFDIKGDLQDAKELSKQTKYNDKEMTKQGNARRGTLHKGFVCRTWATNFLQNNTADAEDDDFIPFFVRKYVDTSKSGSTVAQHVTTKNSLEKKKTLRLTSSKSDREELTKSTSKESQWKLEIVVKQRALVDENDNTKIEKCIKATPGNFESSQNISGRFVCCWGGALTHDIEIKRRAQSTSPTTKYLSHARSSNSKESYCVALPIKQFPPINPLEGGVRKPNSPARIRCGFLPARRPHTVDTAMLLKEAIAVNGHCNLPNYSKTRDLPRRGLYNVRDSIFSLEHYNKDRQMHPGIKFDKNWSGSKHFDEGLRMLCPRSEGRKAKETLLKSSTSPSAAHESMNSQGRRGRYRSLSGPPGNNKQSRTTVDENQNVLYGNTGDRLPLRTPPHSLNGEDNDSCTDSNDTSLGSEIEYTFDGSAKLDIYLQPRGTSFR